MELIKEFTVLRFNSRVIIRTTSYSSNLAHIDSLFAAAQEDFPALKRENCEIMHYAGERYKRTFGLEFNVPIGTAMPSGYEQVRQVELTL